MRTTQVRCDYCNIEIYYSVNEKPAPLHRQRDEIVTVERIGTANNYLCDKEYCSPECLKFAAEKLMMNRITDIDYFIALAEKLRYKIEKIKEIKPTAE